MTIVYRKLFFFLSISFLVVDKYSVKLFKCCNIVYTPNIHAVTKLRRSCIKD